MSTSPPAVAMLVRAYPGSAAGPGGIANGIPKTRPRGAAGASCMVTTFPALTVTVSGPKGGAGRVAKRLLGGERGNGHGRGNVKGHRIRDRCHVRGSGGNPLGPCALGAQRQRVGHQPVAGREDRPASIASRRRPGHPSKALATAQADGRPAS
jgi:hypothetical protein